MIRALAAGIAALALVPGIAQGGEASQAKKKKPAAAKAAAKPQANGNGHAVEIKVGGRFKYRDGADWVPGVVTSLDGVVISSG